MTPESIAKGLLPCSVFCCEGMFRATVHDARCPAHYRPDVARALMEAAAMDREALRKTISNAAWGTGLSEVNAYKIADAILSSNKTRQPA